MTPDELRAAAERIVRTKEEGFGLYTDEHGNGPIMSMYDKDAEDLADAYLAEHPADDGEAVTAEWLQSVGPGKDWECYISEEFGINLPPTRGAVRQLCAALGIPLTEPGVK